MHIKKEGAGLPNPLNQDFTVISPSPKEQQKNPNSPEKSQKENENQQEEPSPTKASSSSVTVNAATVEEVAVPRLISREQTVGAIYSQKRQKEEPSPTEASPHPSLTTTARSVETIAVPTFISPEQWKAIRQHKNLKDDDINFLERQLELKAQQSLEDAKKWIPIQSTPMGYAVQKELTKVPTAYISVNKTKNVARIIFSKEKIGKGTYQAVFSAHSFHIPLHSPEKSVKHRYKVLRFSDHEEFEEMAKPGQKVHEKLYTEFLKEKPEQVYLTAPTKALDMENRSSEAVQGRTQKWYGTDFAKVMGQKKLQTEMTQNHLQKASFSIQKKCLLHVASSLQWIEKKGYSHGDVKNANIFTLWNGTQAVAHLGDWDFAHEFGPDPFFKKFDYAYWDVCATQGGFVTPYLDRFSYAVLLITFYSQWKNEGVPFNLIKGVRDKVAKDVKNNTFQEDPSFYLGEIFAKFSRSEKNVWKELIQISYESAQALQLLQKEQTVTKETIWNAVGQVEEKIKKCGSTPRNFEELIKTTRTLFKPKT